ncbi:zinc finger protein ZPR1 [Selaginella moellendorffii]|uniref:zinc finger protein ZPR1 n=1 Tax=Selaginella moellendorffii TaxID=88036 RepID=UPI000D1C49A3|nr:zinc finger protein ZPR1 [Selaginella moellendorffii]|eukprot:XP_024540130.1 zinc finger protein ZPR1 [Selaginella moellendorffii]
MAEDAHELESLCMSCGENGTTRLLLTTIPHFREIVLMAFECPHCNERNNEVQFAGQLQPQGCRFTLSVPQHDLKALNRQVVKSDSATIKVPELDFEVPPEAQRGVLSTVEGVLLKAGDDLERLQEERRKVDPHTAASIDAFILKLRAYARGEQAFTFSLEDPSGNSFIENPNAPKEDPILLREHYDRTHEQQKSLGFLSVDHENEDGKQEEDVVEELHGAVGAKLAQQAIAQGNSEQISAALFKYTAPEEVMTFPATCGACAGRCETRMYMTNIPYFKEVIVMAASCDTCGFRNSEVKPGGSISAKGKKISLAVENQIDLTRDLIKSDTAGVEIPEVELELMPGTLGGLVTTVEGLVKTISEKLKSVHGFEIGDSAEIVTRQKWMEFDAKLQDLLELKKSWTLVLDDSLGNSFIAPCTDSSSDDNQISVREYERSWEQNEELGLNHMNTGTS